MLSFGVHCLSNAGIFLKIALEDGGVLQLLRKKRMKSKFKFQRLQTLLPILSRQLERQICAHSCQLGHNGQLWRGFVTEENIMGEVA